MFSFLRSQQEQDLQDDVQYVKISLAYCLFCDILYENFPKVPGPKEVRMVPYGKYLIQHVLTDKEQILTVFADEGKTLLGTIVYGRKKTQISGAWTSAGRRKLVDALLECERIRSKACERPDPAPSPNPVPAGADMTNVIPFPQRRRKDKA